MIEAGVPGILRRVAVIRPPLTDPTYIATSKARALWPLMLKVRGKVSEISIAPVRPGIEPTAIPRAVPNMTSMMRDGWDRTSVIIVLSG
jgi:hypothetical protein